MKIALLNMPFDNNYGGNLQRYALMKVLEGMGHDVTHLYTCYAWDMPGRWKWLTVCKRIVLRLLGHKVTVLNPGYITDYIAYKKNKTTSIFFNRYIKHTKPITPYRDLAKYSNYEAYIVGSDQVWRRSMSYWFPFKNMFFSFIENVKGVTRIAYAASLGTSIDEIPDEEKPYLSGLYKKFNAVSVRESSGLKLLEQYGWTQPEAIQTLDPTLLLPRKHYEKLIAAGDTHHIEGNMFCYVLDNTEEVNSTIERIAEERHLKPFRTSIEVESMVSVEQWLRSIKDADYVVTDSFHGFVFSIIFNKPVTLTYNNRRGNDRFESLMELLNYNPKDNDVDWDKINNKVSEERSKSINFLLEALQ